MTIGEVGDAGDGGRHGLRNLPPLLQRQILMKRTPTLIILALSLVTASCGDSGADEVEEASATQPSVTSITHVTLTTVAPVLSEPVPLLVIAETGGCFMMGPNCSTTLVMSDGSFGVFRTDPADILAVPGDVSSADVSGQVDIRELAGTIADSDFADLKSRLEPGTCRGCYDGIDVTVRFHTAAGLVDLDSVEYEFDAGLDLFRHLEAIRTAIRGSGSLEPMQRGE